MGAQPVVSVVVSTYNRAHLVPRLLGALADQKIDDPYEVVIVDNASTDGTGRELEAIAAAFPHPIRVLRTDVNRGPAPARNLGWRAAAAPLVAFTDDDCVPQAGWLAALVEAARQAEIVQGCTLGNPEQEPDGLFSWAPEATTERGFYETCNVAYQRRVLEANDGFDEFLQHTATGRNEGRAATWGDDTDLAWRAKANGATSGFAPDAVVWHDMKPGRLRDRIVEIPRRTGVVATVKRHPGLRDEYESRWFLQRAHGSVLVALAGAGLLAATPRRPVAWLAAAALSVPWIRRRGRHYPRRQWPKVLPQWFLVDTLEVAAMAATSARQRTLFL